MARRSIYGAIFVTTCAGGICGCGSSGSPPASASPSSTPAGIVQISGRERLAWTQNADALDNVHFGVYVDSVRTDLPGFTCRAAQGRTFECNSALPSLSPGVHTLEMMAWAATDARIIESPRADPLVVMVVASGITAEQPTSSIPSSPAGSGPPPAAGACGLAVTSDREILMWTAHGEIEAIDPQRRTSRPISRSVADAGGWVLSGVAAHPQFATTRWIFLTELLNRQGDARVRLSRYRELSDVLGERAVVLEAPLASVPARTSVAFDDDGYLSLALLTSLDHESAPTPAHEHRFLIRVDDQGRVPADNAGRSIFSAATATAPLAVAWNGLREPWIAEPRGSGTYQVQPASVESRSRQPFELAAPPVAMRIVETTRGRHLIVSSQTGELVTMDFLDGDWIVRGRRRVAPELKRVDDFVVWPDGELVLCGPTRDGRYGVSRARAIL